MTLREALEHALEGKPLDDEAREHIRRLLLAKSQEYGTLVDECEIALYG